MGAEIKILRSEERKSRVEATAFLRQIADKIESGSVMLRTGQTEVGLEIPASVILEIQVEDEDKGAKGIQHSLEITLKRFDGLRCMWKSVARLPSLPVLFRMTLPLLHIDLKSKLCRLCSPMALRMRHSLLRKVYI